MKNEFRAWRYSPGFLASIVALTSVAAVWPVERDAAWVAKRVEAWQPTAAERRWEQIGWAGSLREARDLSRKHGRPVFVFTHDGHLNVGRC